jgi:D-sedoheptulose 7-phosphate isomerase
LTAWANDAEYAAVFAEQLENFLDPGDIVIGISTSGNSPNVVRAMEVAKKRQAVTIAFTGRNGGRLRFLVDHCVSVPSDEIGHQEDVHMVLDHVIVGAIYHSFSLAAKATV